MDIRAVWSSLGEPDDYPDDWYGWAKNQMAHILIGIVLALVAALTFHAVVGEYPQRAWLWTCIAAAYFFGVEIAVQRWNRWDTLEDTVFVAGIGSGSVLYSFEEASPHGTRICADASDFIPFAAAAFFMLVMGVARRL